MQTRMQELELAKRVWHQAIDHLERKLTALPREAFEAEVDDDGEDLEIDARRGAIEHQITIYRMCIDWAVQQQDDLDSRDNAPQALERERFYRLMAVLAKAELDRDDQVRATVFVSAAAPAHPSNQRAVEDLQNAASAALLRLIPGMAVAA